MFVILAHQRTGTHLLASLLNSHPSLKCYDEVCQIYGRKKTLLGITDIRKLKKNEGCILMYTQFIRESRKDPEFIGLISQAKIIHLTRRNINNHLKSLFKERGAKFDEDKAERVKEYITKLRKEVFKNKFKNIFPLTYEDICGDHDIKEYENKELLKFLEVKPIKLTTNLTKGINP